MTGDKKRERGKEDKRESLKEGWKEVRVEAEGETKALGATDWWITQRQLDIEQKQIENVWTLEHFTREI